MYNMNVLEGSPYNLGATVTNQGINFAIFSRDATRVMLCFFESASSAAPYAIAEKKKKKNIPFTIEAIEKEITDIAGVRVICSFPEDIYMLADCLLKQDDITLIKKKDYIKNPKPSGYRSLHLIVEVPIFLSDEKRMMKVEVQLRTIAMDFWASLEHKLRYKKNIEPELSAELAKELAECADVSAALDIRMEKIRERIGYGD